MLTTNLLPKEHQKTLELAKTARLTFIAAMLLIGILIANLVFLLPTLLPLLYGRRELSRELQTGKEAQEKFQVHMRATELREVSGSIRDIRGYISKPRYVSKILTLLTTNASPGIAVEMASVAHTGDISITGTAATRKALLDFETLLKNSTYVEDISSPLSNIIRETNIRFTLQGKLKQEVIETAQ